MGRRGEMVEVLRFVRDGKLKPVLDVTMPLARAADAHRRMEAREHFGKIVLTPRVSDPLRALARTTRRRTHPGPAASAGSLR